MNTMENKWLTIENEDQGKILTKCSQEAEGEIIVPEGVVEIGIHAFSRCKNIESIKLPDSVRKIEMAAFKGCDSLTSITIPNSVISIRSRAFEGCSSLSSIIIPDSVERIGKYAFSDCTGLVSIRIPECANIENQAFSGCVNIKEIILPKREVALRSLALGRLAYIFENVDLSQCTIVVPKDVNKDLISYYFEGIGNVVKEQ